ncbi:hypothetical protein BraRD5C2_42320 [Bradyrhizobium sp. RD5-C2]|nr:hypothetical protein BraRD5C2_42320 [Bradyrhizobium sp. RD5-C2]
MLSKAQALSATSRRAKSWAVYPAVAWHRQDVHHQADRQAGARPVPLSELRGLQASALQPRAACRDVPRERHPVLPVRRLVRHLAPVSAECAQVRRRAAA